jgi:hypothetical protein
VARRAAEKSNNCDKVPSNISFLATGLFVLRKFCFTEGQAKSRIEAHGFTGVGRLKKDSDGVWRGTATQSGKSVKVSVDFQGNGFPVVFSMGDWVLLAH